MAFFTIIDILIGCTLVCRIDVQGKINVQVGKFLKKIESADPNKAVQGDFFFSKLINMQDKYKYICQKINKHAGGFFFSKTINVQTEIRPCRGGFFLKINERACTFIRQTRVGEFEIDFQSINSIYFFTQTLLVPNNFAKDSEDNKSLSRLHFDKAKLHHLGVRQEIIQDFVLQLSSHAWLVEPSQ